jgi:acyl-CoA reductase-like NAD-dependent aldehyde dehydrogenase
MSSKRELERFEKIVDRAIQQGAEVVCGGSDQPNIKLVGSMSRQY